VLRNSELRQFAFCFLLLGAILAIIGFLVNPLTGWMVTGSIVAFGTLFALFTRARYQNLRHLADQIDQILHHNELLSLTDNYEGELSILRTEIQKMTVRIREQNLALRAEKEHLADALADIAHQLRTPLTSASLALSLARRAVTDAEREAYLREATSLLMRMDWLITALLKLSRLDADVVEFTEDKIAVTDLVRSALEPLVIPMELREVNCQVDVPTKAYIFGDAQWLAEALQNILKNCVESIGEQGNIIISCRDTAIFTEIVIRDDGPGFATADLPQVFNRFYQGTPNHVAEPGSNASKGGYGIGLALAKTIVTRSGGTIKATNHHDGGAVFVLRFSHLTAPHLTAAQVTDHSLSSHRPATSDL